MGGVITYPLKLTAKATENQWLEDESFLLGVCLFQEEFLVSGRVHQILICWYNIKGSARIKVGILALFIVGTASYINLIYCHVGPHVGPFPP